PGGLAEVSSRSLQRFLYGWRTITRTKATALRVNTHPNSVEAPWGNSGLELSCVLWTPRRSLAEILRDQRRDGCPFESGKPRSQPHGRIQRRFNLQVQNLSRLPIISHAS